MAQTLSTFNTLEQSKFEAFRRSTFRGDAISKYVAYCLTRSEEKKILRLAMSNTYSNAPSSDLHQCLPLPKRELKDLVGTENNLKHNSNPAEEITIVVSTLAKAYAQRLIKAAREVASASNYPESKKILPEHLREAHFQRLNQGIDPGFFMQTPHHIKVSGQSSAGKTLSLRNGGFGAIKGNSNIASSKKYDLKFESAFALQQAFDEFHNVEKQEQENENDRHSKENKNDTIKVSGGKSDSAPDEKHQTYVSTDIKCTGNK